jgi:hypothetical protein
MLRRLLKAEQVKRVSLKITLTRLHGDFGDISLNDPPAFHVRLHHETDTLLMLVTLAHELIHLAQVMDKRLELKEIKGLTTWVWLKTPYGADPYHPDESRELPWELEADELEADLACQFMTHSVSKLNAR